MFAISYLGCRDEICLSVCRALLSACKALLNVSRAQFNILVAGLRFVGMEMTSLHTQEVIEVAPRMPGVTVSWGHWVHELIPGLGA